MRSPVMTSLVLVLLAACVLEASPLYSNDMDFKTLCDKVCDKDWCPPSCSVLPLAAFGKRRAFKPYSEGLGNLSLDDYLFLKLNGRSRK